MREGGVRPLPAAVRARRGRTGSNMMNSEPPFPKEGGKEERLAVMLQPLPQRSKRTRPPLLPITLYEDMKGEK